MTAPERGVEPPPGWPDPTAEPTRPPTTSPPPASAAPPPPQPAPDDAPAFAAPDPAYPTNAAPSPGASPPAASPPDVAPPGAPPPGYSGYPSYGGYGGYGVPPAVGYYGYPVPAVAPKTNGLAIASLVVSISGIVLVTCYGIGGLISAVGAILGHVSRRQIRERQEGGDGMALAGIIVGWIATGLALLVVAFIVVLFVVLAGTAPIPDQDSGQVP